jgi:hypothetical protein
MEIHVSRPVRYIPLIVSIFIHLALLFFLLTYNLLVQKEIAHQPRPEPDDTARHQTLPFQFVLPQSPQIAPTVATPVALPQSSPFQQPTHADQHESSADHAESAAATPSAVAPAALKASGGPVATQTTHAPQRKRKRTKQKPQLTLKDITKGVFKNIKEHTPQSKTLLENDTTTAGIQPQSIPDAKDLALHAYRTKTFNVLQGSVQGTTMHLHNSIDNVTVTLSITVDKKGVLKDLTIIHDNKTESMLRLEALMKKAAQTAGLFPPIPDHLNKDTMTHLYRMVINARAGTDTYYLYPMIFR